MTLTEFLLARIAEDEAAALRLCPGRNAANGHWRRGSLQDEAVRAIDPLDADHVLRHDPARVLAECEAKRRIVELNATKPGRKTTFRRLLTLQTLALPYADHPDYRQEWKP